jgi:hypothetical protein
MNNPTQKLGVSSRPWIMFEEAFRNKPQLMLQDLTRQDMRDCLPYCFQDLGFSAIKSQHFDVEERLVFDIVEKTTGDFFGCSSSYFQFW